MIISHLHRCIFLKTEKTASTSIEIALSRVCGDADVITAILPEDEQTRRQFGGRNPQNCNVPFDRYDGDDWIHLRQTRIPVGFYNHMPASDVRRFVGDDVWASYFTFCFERNPWDRAISLYYWETQAARPRPSLREFLTSADPSRLTNFGIYSIDDRVAVDRVGRYESLDLDLVEMAQQLRLPDINPIPRTKTRARTDRRHYREVLGTVERRVVTKACAREIELLGYEY